MFRCNKPYGLAIANLPWKHPDCGCCQQRCWKIWWTWLLCANWRIVPSLWTIVNWGVVWAMSCNEYRWVVSRCDAQKCESEVLVGTPLNSPDVCCLLIVCARRYVFSDLVFWNGSRIGPMWLQTIPLNEPSVLISFSFMARTTSIEKLHGTLNGFTARRQTATEWANKNERSAGVTISISVYDCIQNWMNLHIVAPVPPQRNQSSTDKGERSTSGYV